MLHPVFCTEYCSFFNGEFVPVLQKEKLVSGAPLSLFQADLIEAIGSVALVYNFGSHFTQNPQPKLLLSTFFSHGTVPQKRPWLSCLLLNSESFLHRFIKHTVQWAS